VWPHEERREKDSCRRQNVRGEKVWCGELGAGGLNRGFLESVVDRHENPFLAASEGEIGPVSRPNGGC